MIKLVKELGTKYVHDYYIEDVIDLMKVAEENDETVDLAGCMFRPDSVKVISRNCGRVKMCNSEDADLDAILKANMLASKVTPLEVTAIPNGLGSQDEVIKYLKELDKDKLYAIKDDGYGITAMLALAIIMTMRHPEITIDLSARREDFFKQIRLDWLKRRNPHKSYLEAITGGSIVTRTVDKDGNVYRPGYGKISEEMYVQNYLVIPSGFGTKRMSKQKEYKEVWETALKSVVRRITTKERTMRDYIEIVGEEDE